MGFSKIFKGGNSAVIVLPAGVLKAAGLKVGDDVVVETVDVGKVKVYSVAEFVKEGEK